MIRLITLFILLVIASPSFSATSSPTFTYQNPPNTLKAVSSYCGQMYFSDWSSAASKIVCAQGNNGWGYLGYFQHAGGNAYNYYCKNSNGSSTAQCGRIDVTSTNCSSFGSTWQWDTSKGSCKSPPQCPSGSSYNSSDQLCHTPDQDCPAHFYRLPAADGGGCVAQPDCNIDHPNGGYHFDVQSRSCVESPFDGTVLACSNSARPVACYTLNDCIAAGEFCSNNQADIDEHNQIQPAVNAQAKDDATASANAADASKNDALAASSAKAASASASQQTAQTAATAAQSNPTPETLATAANAAAQASFASQAANNASSSAAAASQHANEAANQRDLITPNYPPGQSQNAADRAADAANEALEAAQDALKGQAPNATDAPKEDTGTCPDCATEETLNKLMEGEGKQLQTKEAGTFDNAIPDQAVEEAKSEYEAKVSTIKQQIQSMFNIDITGTSSLPSWDFGTIKGYHVVVDLNHYASQLSYVGLMIVFLAVVVAARVVLE